MKRHESGRTDAEGQAGTSTTPRTRARLLIPLLATAALLLTACDVEPASPGLPDGVQPTTIAVGTTPEGQRFLILGTLENGAHVSFNDGVEWTKSEGLRSDRPQSREGPAILDLATAPDGREIFAATSSGLYRTLDNGQSWIPVVDTDERPTTFDAAFQVSISPDYEDSGFILIRANGPNFGETVFRSTDHGATWEPTLSRPYNDIQALDDQRIGIATGSTAVIRTANSHAPPTTLFELDRAVARITFDPDFYESGIVFAGGGFTSWSTVKRVNAISGEVLDTGLYLDGPVWRDNIMAELNGSGGYLSTTHLPDAAILSPFFSSDGTGFIISSDGLARTTDHGLTWQIVEMPIPDNEDIQAVAFSPAFAESNVVFGVTDRRLLKSTNGGATWNAYPNLDQLPPIPTRTPLPTATPGPSPTPGPTATAASLP